jgi:23S rRNA (cytosine1962-C5)-methyltransferase
MNQSAASPPAVVLRKNLARSIRRGQPWIFRDALRPTAAIADGALVVVTTPDGQPLARGFWDARSAIAVRVLAVAGGGGAPATAAAQPEPGDGDLPALVEARALAALDRRLAHIQRAHTDAFRVLHGEADALPGVHADLYGDAIAVRFDGDGARAFYLDRADLPQRLVAVARRRDIRVAAVIERKRGDDQVARRALVGQVPERELEVRENDLLFGVDLARGQKGGLFLDQRDNRAYVRTIARDRRVLNLFGYTGGFSIYAAAGGAAHTTTVDLARAAVAAARDNFTRNGLALATAVFHAGDAFDFLAQAARDRVTFDLVISDPPSFAPSRKALPAALRAYRRLHRMCAAVTAPGGVLCAASCSSHVDREQFARTVTEGVADAGRRWDLDQMRGAAADHPVVPEFPEGDYLKFAVGRVSSGSRS